ncbi:ATP-dependent helicase [Bryobacter aggregatus]|uniref:ATP-dependent helicase n=1 Tax=Bryobacter aggregatus TaxID=360054 RepID=UPI00055CDC26|nr:UvrD-helicase domain-containing protein [Bryobacter aggregatus]
MDFLEGLNPSQREAAAHGEGALLILAGAGSGKTRVITHRMANLVHAHKVPGYSVLAVTFTNKAAAEMKERVQHLLDSTGENYESPFVSTFHSFCVRMLRRDGDRLADLRHGFTRQFNIYDDDDQMSLIKQIFKGLGVDEKFMQYRAALGRISKAKSHHETPQDLHKNAREPIAARMAVIYEQYEAKLRQANAVDFDDLLLESVRLLRHDTQLRETYNRRYNFVMVDEYQDTNRSQYEMMRLLSDSHGNVVAVGDEDQSIYSWRGADIRNILDFERDYRDAKIIRLEQNYRSTKNIIEAASTVVSNNTQRKGKTLWTEQSAGPKIGLYEALDGENEALWIADRIDKILDRDRAAQVAILYRTNFQSRQIEEALRRYGRKYNVVGGLSFYQRAEIKDALSYLKLIVNPGDSIAFLRVVNTPARGIGKTTLDQVDAHARTNQSSLWEASGQLVEQHALGSRAEAAITAFRQIILDLRENLETTNIRDLLKELLARTGYIKALEENPAPENEGRLANLNELINAAAESAERGEAIGDFLDHAALVSDSDKVDEKAQISLLTIHNAKGLEFPVVFLAGMEEGLFPHSRALVDDHQMEEERRLCYVGMTRARQQLFMTWARMRRKYGGGTPEPALTSRFIREVPEPYTERLSRVAVVPQIDLSSEQWEARDTVRKYSYGSRPSQAADNINSFFGAGNSASTVRPTSRPTAPAALPRPVAPPPRPVPPAPPPPPKPKTASLFSDEEAPPWEVSTSAPTPAKRPATTPPLVKPAPPPQLAQRPAAAGAKTFVPAKQQKAPSSGIRSGSVVMHARYGKGTVMSREGDGDDAKLVISFPGFGLKKLIEKFAGIKKLD